MRREGRQHGYTRSPPRTKIIKIADTEEDGLKCSKEKEIDCGACFHKVDSFKPTNQSKFRGRCRQARCRYCHLEPSSKSRAKTKGLRKHTSSDLPTSYRLCAWRVAVDRNPHRLSSNAGQSSSDFISLFAQGDDDYLDDDECSHTSTEEAAEEVIEIPVRKEEEPREEVDITEFCSCESDSWTTENLCETDLEEWCLVENDM